jgi:uncharacterized protein (DUF2141 family)
VLEILASLMMIVPTNASATHLKATSPEAVSPIEITFNGIKSSSGKIEVAIFDARAADSFPKSERALKRLSIENTSQEGRLTATLPDLPPGDYALAIFHDEDSDGVFKFGLFGIPREGLAFSNNPKIYFGPPSFDKAKVNVGSIRRLDIEMKYF